MGIPGRSRKYGAAALLEGVCIQNAFGRPRLLQDGIRRMPGFDIRIHREAAAGYRALLDFVVSAALADEATPGF
jgi:hypothetical protein